MSFILWPLVPDWGSSSKNLLGSRSNRPLTILKQSLISDFILLISKDDIDKHTLILNITLYVSAYLFSFCTIVNFSTIELCCCFENV